MLFSSMLLFECGMCFLKTWFFVINALENSIFASIKQFFLAPKMRPSIFFLSLIPFFGVLLVATANEQDDIAQINQKFHDLMQIQFTDHKEDPWLRQAHAKQHGCVRGNV